MNFRTSFLSDPHSRNLRVYKAPGEAAGFGVGEVEQRIGEKTADTRFANSNKTPRCFLLRSTTPKEF
jgi:hypothetical protein